MTPIRVAIGLGSNIDAEQNLKAASDLLRKAYPNIRFSHVYTTAARDYEDQDDFLNAVGVVETKESVDAVLTTLRSIESALGKTLPFKSGPRTIDLDILLYGDEVIRRDDLTVPHPRMHERRFVLEPLVELMNEPTWRQLLKATLSQESAKTPIQL